jgi:hypothetical protein
MKTYNLKLSITIAVVALAIIGQTQGLLNRKSSDTCAPLSRPTNKTPNDFHE